MHRQAQERIERRMPCRQAAAARVGGRRVGYHRLAGDQGRAEQRVEVVEQHAGLRMPRHGGAGGVVPADVGQGVTAQVGLVLRVVQHLGDQAVAAAGQLQEILQQGVEGGAGRIGHQKIGMRLQDRLQQLVLARHPLVDPCVVRLNLPPRDGAVHLPDQHVEVAAAAVEHQVVVETARERPGRHGLVAHLDPDQQGRTGDLRRQIEGAAIGQQVARHHRLHRARRQHFPRGGQVCRGAHHRAHSAQGIRQLGCTCQFVLYQQNRVRHRVRRLAERRPRRGKITKTLSARTRQNVFCPG